MKKYFNYILALVVVLGLAIGYYFYSKSKEKPVEKPADLYKDPYVELLKTPILARQYAGSFQGDLGEAMRLFEKDNFLDYQEKTILVAIFYNNIKDAQRDYKYTDDTEGKDYAETFATKNKISIDILLKDAYIMEQFDKQFDAKFYDNYLKLEFVKLNDTLKKLKDTLK